MIAFACSEEKPVEPEPDNSIIDSVVAEDSIAEVTLVEGAEIYHLTCMGDLLSVLETPGDESSMVVTAADDVADRFEGYYLDGEFVYPTYHEGCDVVACVQVNWEPAIPLISYSVEEDQMIPPED